MLHDTNDKTVRFHFDSLQELQRHIDDTPRTWRAKYSMSDSETSENWDLNAGYRGALKLAREGWQSGAEKLAAGLLRLPALKSTPRTTYGVAGTRPHIGRYASGVDACMIRRSNDAQRSQRPVITLAVPVNATADIKASAMSNYGLAIARYIDELEAGGQRVELVAAIVSIVSGKRLVHSWTVKHASEHMDFATVAFSLGHPAMFRRLGFALRERSPVREDSGYGMSQDLRLSDLIDCERGTIILNGMKNANAIAYNPDKALENVGRQIQAALDDPEAASA